MHLQIVLTILLFAQRANGQAAMVMCCYERPLAAAAGAGAGGAAAPTFVPAATTVRPSWAVSFGEAPLQNPELYAALLGTNITGNIAGATGVLCNGPGLAAFTKTLPARLLYEGAPAGIPAPIPPGGPANANDFTVDLFTVRNDILDVVRF
jgi:hypothetical protein